MAFEKHLNADELRRSAVAAIKGILPLPLVEIHKRKLLSLATWYLTEADGGKYGTRYRSARSLLEADKRLLRHEHVYQRRKMIDAFLANPDNIENIASLAVACVVTKDEHTALGRIDPTIDGWARYKKAQIEVKDMATDQTADLDAMIAALEKEKKV